MRMMSIFISVYFWLRNTNFYVAHSMNYILTIGLYQVYGIVRVCYDRKHMKRKIVFILVLMSLLIGWDLSSNFSPTVVRNRETSGGY